MDILVDDVIHLICSHLDRKEIISLAGSNKRLNNVCWKLFEYKELNVYTRKDALMLLSKGCKRVKYSYSYDKDITSIRDQIISQFPMTDYSDCNLEHYTTLAHLCYSKMGDLSGLENLYSLDLNDHKIIEELAHLKNIVHLNIRETSLCSIPKFDKLETLIINRVYVKDIIKQDILKWVKGKIYYTYPSRKKIAKTNYIIVNLMCYPDHIKFNTTVYKYEKLLYNNIDKILNHYTYNIVKIVIISIDSVKQYIQYKIDRARSLKANGLLYLNGKNIWCGE